MSFKDFTALASELDIHADLIYRWRREALANLGASFPGQGNKTMTEEQKEIARLFQHGSMSRKGDCWDNAVAESFFKTLKVEHIYHNSYKTFKEAELSVFEYIEAWYNVNRIHTTSNRIRIHYHKTVEI